MNTPTINTENTIFGHPKGLFYLFFAELWERFSFYGMRALLTLYMINKLFESLVERDIITATIYASYGSLVYASPLLGGRIADHLLGYRKSILLGGILMTLGHLSLAFEANFMFFLGLGFIVVGNGFFKPNISTMVGTLYPKGSTRKDSGFTIFYMGINLGGAAAPLLCGYLGLTYGWEYGFSLAAIGMISGVLFFAQGIKAQVFQNHGLPPNPNALHKRSFGITAEWWVYLLAVAAAPLMAWLISAVEKVGRLSLTPVGIIFGSLGVFLIGYMGYILYKATPKERNQLTAALVLTLWMTIFWGFFELQGSALTLFAQRNVNLLFMNASQTNSINSVFILLFAIPISLLWGYLSRRKANPRSPYKFAYGLLWASAAFYALYLSKYFASDQAQVPVLFLLGGYAFISAGELFMSPVGLSKITDLAPKRIASFMMGVWVLSSAYAFLIVGLVGQWLAVEKVEGTPDPFVSLNIYTDGFLKISGGLLLIGIVALITAPLVTRWMKGVH